jgi:phosphatidylinositol-3,4,5-trisphosphate 3-phosphatase/dual-specificity protein phosphatase PTEN
MSETVRFLRTYHQSRYKVYNLCSERFYEPQRLTAPVLHLPFDDHQVCQGVNLGIVASAFKL